MFTQPDMRLDLADQIQRERLAVADRHRIAAAAVTRPHGSWRPSRRFARARTILAIAGARILG
ncbi:MAG TPA: hypothetical protein VH459_03770 [Gaiellales bacterium]|jgi:hypothetical protein